MAGSIRDTPIWKTLGEKGLVTDTIITRYKNSFRIVFLEFSSYRMFNRTLEAIIIMIVIVIIISLKIVVQVLLFLAYCVVLPAIIN